VRAPAAPPLRRLGRALAALAATAALSLPVLRLAVPGTGVFASGSGAAQPAADAVLEGTIDIHVHSDPDSFARSLDGLEAARLAQASGMRAIVLKNHFDPTAGLAFLARQQARGLDVFGGVVLNRPVGGVNPAAVEHMTEVSGGWGRIVWMPTFDAEHHVRSQNENRPFVSVSRDGELLPEVKAVIALVVKHGLALATGHSAPEESLLLLREGRRLGLQRMVVTHPMQMFVQMGLPQMQAATREGAFLEFVGGSLAGEGAAAQMDRYAQAIRAIGPEFCILSSDLGQRGNPLPAEGFGAFIRALRDRGFTGQEIDLMTKRNPARLLGMER
jgi:hypothetical protein